MRTLFPFARIVALVVFIFSSVQVQAESSPFATPQTTRHRINLISNNDWIEVNHANNGLESLSINFVDRRNNSSCIAIFIQDGPAPPELMSIFKSKRNSRQLIIAIVKWHHYLPGANTEGDYYEVHAYEFEKFGDMLLFSEDKNVSDFFGSGFDGKKEGKTIRFRFKNATAIRRALPILSHK
ncbi:hypothetical protein [Cupriavidus necator]